MSLAKSKGSSCHWGKESIVEKSPPDKEGDEKVSFAELDHSQGEERVRDLDSECPPLLNLWYNTHSHFSVVADSYTYPPPDWVWLFLEQKVTNVSWALLPSTICRHHIMYPLRLEPPFPNDVGIIKPKVGLGLDHIEIDLRKVFSEKYNSFMS